MTDSPRFEVRRIVGAGQTEQLLVTRIALPEPAWAIPEVQKTVLIDQVHITLGHVLIQGRLRVRYTLAGSAPVPGVNGPGVVRVAAGPLSLLTFDRSFAAAVTITGAEPAMSAEVLAAHVTADASSPAGVTPEGAITAMCDQSIVAVCVKVICREELPGGAGPEPRAARSGPTKGQKSVISRFSCRGAPRT